MKTSFQIEEHLIEEHQQVRVLRLQSTDGTNRLTSAVVLSLTEALGQLAQRAEPLVITGNHQFFSAGAELEQIAALDGPSAFAFARMGQALMSNVERFPAPTYAAIGGYCMGGGLDLALACRWRIAAPDAIFGHRGAALGLITGWGGTQRMPRLIGKGRALEMFVTADKVSAPRSLQIGLIDGIASDPVAEAIRHLKTGGNLQE